MSTLLDSIRRAFGVGAAQRAVGYQRDVVLTITGVIASTDSPGATKTVNFQEDPTQTPTSVFQVPLDRRLVIEDIYVSQSYAPANGQLRLIVNGDKVVSYVSDINDLLVSNPSRARPSPFILNPGDRLTGQLIVTGVPSSGSTTVVVKARGRYIVG
jgi:hypothetical protein